MYFDRAKLEAMEAQTLAPYGVQSSTSRGRPYPEAEPRYRTAFQRDRDRIIHAAAFRQLEYKTQVFVNDTGDYYRTRLTHTLEVAQIGRTLARALGANQDLTETICLAHDLGHPPFGHAGEDALDKLMRDHGGFNHNHQSYRVVTALETRYPDFPGLNLTWETLEGLAKHETSYDLTTITGFDPTQRGTLEAQIADTADELAYNAHDLDDGLRAGILKPDGLRELELWRVLCDRLNWRGHHLDEVTRHVFIRELVGLMVDDVLTATQIHLDAINPQTPLDIQCAPYDIVGYSAEVGAMGAALKRYLYDQMYYSFRIVRMKMRAEWFIDQIFNTLIKEPRQLPDECQSMLLTRTLHRVVADYIASMTDRGALLEYRYLYDPLTRP
ncbi:MAG: deoxyguanosinetriphosphate triphosphohydrolase [Chloroflexota bacterium]|nr:deoxyguanosinetriphosphate triphosphohydrolase [Chloroflexota bacterium]